MKRGIVHAFFALVCAVHAGCGDDSLTPSCSVDMDCPADRSCFEGFCIEVPRSDTGTMDSSGADGGNDGMSVDAGPTPTDSGSPDTFDSGPVPMRTLADYPGCERDADCPIGLGRCLTELTFNLPDADGTTSVTVQSIDPSLTSTGICTLPCTEDAAACGGLQLRVGDMPVEYSCQVVVAGVSPYDDGAAFPFAVDVSAATAGRAFAAICRPPLGLSEEHADSLCEPCTADDTCGAGALCWDGVVGVRGTEAAPGECIEAPAEPAGCSFGFEPGDLVESDGTTAIGEFCVPILGTCGPCQDGDGDGNGVGLCIGGVSPSPIDCDDTDSDAYFDPLDMNHAFPMFCGAFDKNCNGESDDAEQFVSADHCGGCGVVCAGATGMGAAAAARQCQPDGSCGVLCDDPTAQADCDGNNENGCETAITDPARLVYYDGDGDGDGTPDMLASPQSPLFTCTPGVIPVGYAATNTDCDDGNSTISGEFGVDTSCDNVDQNCSGAPDDGYVPVTCSTGLQGICAAGTTSCGAGASVMCNQDNAPAEELCGNLGTDDDCDGSTTEIRLLDQDTLAPTGVQVNPGDACTATSLAGNPVLGACQNGVFFVVCSGGGDGALCEPSDPTADTHGNGVDEDCDGVDGVATDAVYVATTGSDAGAGTPASPYLTVQRGIDVARATGKSIVRVAEGIYARITPLIFRRGVVVVGRLRPANGWATGGGATTVRISYNNNPGFNGVPGYPGSLGLTCEQTPLVSITAGSDFVDYEVSRFSTGSNAESLVGAWFENCAWIRLRHGTLTVANAAATVAPDEGASGAPGLSGADGNGARLYQNTGHAGGLGAASGCASSGGAGGQAGDAGFGATRDDGRAGGSGVGPAGTGGSGGGAATGNVAGGTGGIGQAGGHGAAGGAGGTGSSSNVISVSAVLNGINRRGGSGTTGNRGGGGGGGGGGGAGLLGVFDHAVTGTSGGGGGGGGCGGLGGIGGIDGGASIGLVVEGADITFVNFTIRAGAGGTGATGAEGGTGAIGGAGGVGGFVNETGAGQGGAGGTGGTGGTGGNGAGGGGGGGGGGGSSIAVAVLPGASFGAYSGNPQLTLVPGAAGGGGAGGAGGTGTSAATGSTGLAGTAGQALGVEGMNP